MSRNESDRVDLYDELTACTSRWELDCDGFEVPVLIGIRKDDALSLFFGPDPVYHYNDQNQLKRAYVNGFLYRTQGHTLARLQRERTETATTLLRHDLSEDELRKFLESMGKHVLQLSNALGDSSFHILRENTGNDVSLKDVESRIENVLHTTTQLAPAFPTRRT